MTFSGLFFLELSQYIQSLALVVVFRYILQVHVLLKVQLTGRVSRTLRLTEIETVAVRNSELNTVEI